MQIRHDSAKFAIGLALFAVRTGFMPSWIGSSILKLVFVTMDIHTTADFWFGCLSQPIQA